MSFLETHKSQLNSRQLEAVATTEGPVLVLAGAGSGKTRVLTYRIAHLIYDKGLPLFGILAMTFSNRAAREMHDRVKLLLKDSSPYRMPWISTFHSVSARLLRQYGARLGYQADFAIYDTSDQLQILKTCFENLKISEKSVTPEAALKRIGDWKNQARLPHELENMIVSSYDQNCANLYHAYAAEMFRAQAMDFDDLLLNTYRLFRENADVKDYYQKLWSHILIDEFQDTNEIQYRLLKEFMGPARNICVVGDDDQSIYGWRGAKIENILNFDKEFSGAKVVRLEQNYRSTGHILKAAASVIARNEVRHEKTLWTEEGDGEKIRLAILEDDRGESNFVIGEIRRAIQNGLSPREIAIFYRVNSLSRGFEEECLRHRIPYQIVGGFRFYERKEIKDLLSYLKILLNPSDLTAFRRSISNPSRGVGQVSVEKLENFANEAQLPIGLWLAAQTQKPVGGKAGEGVMAYREFLKWGFSALENSQSLVDLVIDTIQKSGYRQMLEKQKSEENEDRKENIEELLSAVQDFEETYAASVVSEGPITLKQKLRDFLERVSLIADIDQLDEKEHITMMSLHSAKGLEFKVCFMTGMEEGLFPSARSFDSYERTEEERRLCYVGITRAREKLYLTRAARRRAFGTINYHTPSRFLREIPQEVFETVREEEPIDSPFDDYSAEKWGRKQTKPVDDFIYDQTAEGNFSYRRGDQVTHPSFGSGVVYSAEYMGEDECLSIIFRGKGMKKVLAKFVSRGA